MAHLRVYLSILAVAALFGSGVAQAQGAPNDTDESAYAPSTLAKILGGAARSQNDEAELAGSKDWYTTTATFTGRKRTPSGRFRPIIGAWHSSESTEPRLVTSSSRLSVSTPSG